MKTIGFIGCGNMGKAMVEGIMKAQLVDGDHMIVSNQHPEKLETLSRTYDLYISDNETVACNADILFLAVKPHMYGKIIEEIREHVKPNAIMVNIAAGVTLADLYAMFALAFGEMMSKDDKEDIIDIFESFGQCAEVQESMMEAVTVVSGSSPAYMFMILEAMADEAVLEGMPRKDAYKFAAQAMLGSAKMLLETGKHPGELKDMVCSPGGTTIEAVMKMEEKGLRSAIMEGMRACADKSRKMTKK